MRALRRLSPQRKGGEVRDGFGWGVLMGFGVWRVKKERAKVVMGGFGGRA